MYFFADEGGIENVKQARLMETYLIGGLGEVFYIPALRGGTVKTSKTDECPANKTIAGPTRRVTRLTGSR